MIDPNKRFPMQNVNRLLAWWDWPFDKITKYAKAIATGDEILFQELSS